MKCLADIRNDGRLVRVHCSRMEQASRSESNTKSLYLPASVTTTNFTCILYIVVYIRCTLGIMSF